MNFDFYHNYILQSYCCNLHYILAYLLFSVSNKPLPLPSIGEKRPTSHDLIGEFERQRNRFLRQGSLLQRENHGLYTW